MCSSASSLRRRTGDAIPRPPASARLAWGLLALVLSGDAFGQLPAQPVVAEAAQKRKMPRGETLLGTVKPLRTSTVGSAVEALVEKFPVNEGDAVEKGAVLAQLRVVTTEIELCAARAELALRAQELAELENGSRPEEIAQADAELAAAEAIRGYAVQRLRRAQELVERSAATADELEERSSAAAAAERAFDARLAAWLLVCAGPRVEKIEQARARVAAQEETVRRLEDQKELHTLRAPFHGYVTKEHTEVGQWIARGSPVAEVVDISQVYVEVPVLENHVWKLRPGMEGIPVDVTSIPGKRLEGRIDSIVPQGDLRSRSFPVNVRVDNPSSGGRPLLAPGMLARVTLPVGDEAEVLAVPKDALVLDQGARQAKVWVVLPETGAEGPGSVRPVPVKVGSATDRKWIEVEGALKPGELVIVEGNETVVPARGVKVERVRKDEAPK